MMAKIFLILNCFHALIDSFVYLMIIRPNIVFLVGRMQYPKKSQCIAITKRILRYVNSTFGDIL